MNITDVKIEDIIPYHDNPRVNEDAINVVKKSLEEFGFQQPLVLDKDNTIIVGHTRYAAATELGYKEIPCFIADNLNEEKIKAYRIMDNKSAEYASWNYGLLTKEMTELLEADYDLEFTGFTDEELADLGLDFNLEEYSEEGLTDEDSTPELVKDPVTKLGDVWILGNHRLICGDSSSIDAINKLMQGVYPDLIHTDPPYGMNAVSNSGVLSKNYDGDIMGDDNQDVAKDTFALIYSLYPEAKQIWWGANYYSSALPDCECWIVWDKNNGQSDQTDCELAWTNFRSVVRQFTQASEKTNRIHPTQKPVSLTEWIIKRFKLSSKTIADYFGGSGSTLIAAEKHGIKSYIMELDPKYCDLTIQRWQNYTGKEAILEATDETYNSLANNSISNNEE